MEKRTSWQVHILGFFDNQNHCLENPWLFHDFCDFLTNSMTIPGLENKNHFTWLFQATGTLWKACAVVRSQDNTLATTRRCGWSDGAHEDSILTVE